MWPNVKSHEFADTVAFNDPFTAGLLVALFGIHNSIFPYDDEVIRQILVSIEPLHIILIIQVQLGQ